MPALSRPGGPGQGRAGSVFVRALAAALLALAVFPAGARGQSATSCIATADTAANIPSGSNDISIPDVTVNCAGGSTGETITFNLRIDLSAPVSGLTATIQTDSGSYQGFRTGANSLTWPGVALPPPGGSGLRTFRITGVRINAAQAAAGTVLMFLDIAGTPPIVISNQTIGVGNVSAPASPLSCSVSAANPPQVQSLNSDAAVAEVTVQCTGGQANTPAALSLQVYLSASVTSQTATLSADASTYQGSRIASNSIAWPAVPVTQPGAGGAVFLRMTGIRINATTAAAGPVTANVTASSLSSVVMTSSQAVVAQVAGVSTAPRITAVNPVTPLATGLRTVSFTGSNFVAGLTVAMNRPDGVAMAGGSVTVVNVTATSFSVTVDFGGVAGSYSIAARNPDGQTSPVFSFPVVLDSGPAARAGAMAQFASGGGWKTTIRLLNLTRDPASVRITLIGSDGAPAQLPLVVTQGGVSVSMSGAVVDRTILSHGGLQVETDAAFSATTVGWVEIRGSAPVTGFAIFRQRHGGGSESEGTSPLDSRTSQNAVLPFDNQSGFSTGVAVANLSPASPATVTAICRDDLGREFYRDAFVIPVNGHSAFSLPARWPSLAGRTGTIEFQSSVAAGIAALGLRFSPSLNFTSLPTSVPDPLQ
ncbi:MAG: hypothetical protein C0504_10920 [Candidatus Solibacter sp.]|nr:hypothetical protein [Candidatus Solibacter sp.]